MGMRPRGSPSLGRIVRRVLANLTLPLSLGRLWITFVWALVLGAGVGVWVWMDDWFSTQAWTMNLLLLPEREPDGPRREALRRTLLNEAVVREARWLSPDELLRSLERSQSELRPADLIPSEPAWLPWVLELRPRDPLTHAAEIQALVARLGREADWELALWDAARLHELVALRGRLRALLGVFLGLVLVGGMAALLRTSWPRQAGWWLVGWSALLGAGGPAVLWMAAQLAGLPVEPTCALAGAGAGFLLAAVFAPVLRVRGNRGVTLSITEADNERVR